MKFKVVRNPWFMFWANGMVFWPWVFCHYRRIYADPQTVAGRHRNLENEKWNQRLFKHEIQHVYQVKKYGRLKFLGRYLWKWVTAGFSYKRHPMEIEARIKENEPLTPAELNWYRTGRIEV